MAWVDVALGVASIGMGAASAAGAFSPSQPNLGSASQKISNAQLSYLPIQRQLEAAANAGTSVTVNLPQHQEVQQYVNIPSNFHGGEKTGAIIGSGVGAVFGGPLGAIGTGTFGAALGGMFGDSDKPVPVPYVASEWQPGGKYYKLTKDGTKPPKPFDHTVTVKAGPHTFDFSGYGAGDTQAALAKASAKVQLALSQKYDSQFIDSAKEQEKLANPEGVAARERESELIQQQINSHPENPVATELQGQVSDELHAGKGLTDFDRSALNQSVADALKAREGGNGQAQDWESLLTTGFAGEQRRMAGIQKASSLLGSGVTTGDVDYRREQQNLANLASEISGKTPTSEFSSLSAAQTGPSPVVNGSPLPTLPTNNLGLAASAASTQYAQQSAQPNSWLTGLSLATSAGNTAQNIWGKK